MCCSLLYHTSPPSSPAFDGLEELEQDQGRYLARTVSAVDTVKVSRLSLSCQILTLSVSLMTPSSVRSTGRRLAGKSSSLTTSSGRTQHSLSLSQSQIFPGNFTWPISASRTMSSPCSLAVSTTWWRSSCPTSTSLGASGGLLLRDSPTQTSKPPGSSSHQPRRRRSPCWLWTLSRDSSCWRKGRWQYLSVINVTLDTGLTSLQL